MKLKSPAFEEALRRKVWAEIRRSPALKRERKRAGRRQIKLPSVLVHLSFTSVGLLILSASYSRSLALAAGLLAFFGTMWLFHLAGRLRFALVWDPALPGLYRNPALPVFDGLPLGSDQVFRHQWSTFTRETIWVSVLFVVAYLRFELAIGLGAAQLTGAILLALLQWLLIYSASVLIVARWPRCRFEMIPGLLGCLAFPLFLAPTILHERFFPLIEPLMEALSWITPAGGLNSLFLHGVVNGDWPWFALVVPVALLGATVPSSRRRLLEMHRAREPVFFRWPEITAEEVRNLDSVVRARVRLPMSTRTGPTEIEDAIRARSFLPEPTWPKVGLLERWVARWLTLREKAVADFMFLYAPGWTAGWKRAAILLAVALPLSLLLARSGNDWFLPVFCVSSLVIAVWALASSHLNWWLFRRSQVGAVRTPIHAFFPFSYGEIARVIFKTAAVRALASLPLLGTLGAVGAWHYGENAGWGALIGCNFAALSLCLNPLLVTLPFSNQTSGFKLARLRSWMCVVPFVSGLFLVSTLTFVHLWLLFLAPDVRQTPILTPIIGVFAYALFRWHRFAYDRCWFDTMNLAR